MQQKALLLCLHHFIDAVNGGARRAQSRLPASRRNDRVALVEFGVSFFRLLLLKEIDVRSRVSPSHLVGRRHRSLDSDQILEPRAR